MRIIVSATIVCLTFLAILNGCATLTDAKNAKGTGSVKIYDASYDEVWAIIPEALASIELPIVGENKSEGYVLAQRGISAFSYGENVAIYVEEASDKRTRVEVISKKSLSTTVFAPDWEPKVIDGISKILRRQ